MLAKYGRALHGSRGNEKRHSISLEAEGGALTIGAAMGFEIILPHRVKNEEAPHIGGACGGMRRLSAGRGRLGGTKGIGVRSVPPCLNVLNRVVELLS